MSEPTAAPIPAGSITLYDPKTNAPIVVDAEHAHDAILSGQLNYAPGTRVPVRVDGKIGTVDADELGDAVAKYGAKSVTSKAFHEHELQQEYGSTPQAALTLGVNALDSATIGASTALIGGIGGQKTREYLRKLDKANESAAMVGQGIGFVAPIAADVLSGGSLTPALAAAEVARAGERGLVSAAEKSIARSALEGAGSVIAAPTKLVSGIGDIAENASRGLVGKEAESASARLAQNIIAGGARGAVEGGIYGVGSEVGHQYLQDDPTLTGEALGSAFVHGALLGGTLGGALHGVGGMLKSKAPRLATEEIARGAPIEGHAAPLAAAEPAVADAAAKAIISQVDDASTAKVLSEAWKNRATAFSKHEDLLDDATRKIAKSLNETLEAGHVVDMASFGESKSNQMAKLVPAESLAPARDAALKVWADAKNVIDELNSQVTKGGAEGSVKRLGKWLQDFADVPKHEWNSPSELFDKIDDFKRRVGKESGFGKSAFGREEATQQFNALYDRIRLALEDQSTWGAAAVAQKEINAATADMIGTGRAFEGTFTRDYGNRLGSGAPKPVANPDAIAGFINGLNSAKNDLKLQMFEDYSRKRTAYLDAVSRNYALDPAAKKAVAAELAAHKAMGETIAKTGSEAASINQLKRIMAEEKGHGIGGLIGMAIDAVSKPGHSLARLAEIEATKNRVLAKVDGGINSVKRALSGKKPGLAPKLSSPETYEDRRKVVLAAASNPDMVHAHLQGEAAPMSASSPLAATAMTGAAIRTMQYLVTSLPKPPPAAGNSLTPQVDMEAWQPSDQQKAQFNRKFDAATHPEHVLALVANGTVTPQHVEALQATHPAMYGRAADALDKDLKSRKKPVPYEMQAPIKTFLQMPQMDPEIQRLLKNGPISSPSAPPQGLKRPLKMTDNTTLNANKE